MKFTKIPEDTFKNLQMNAGIICSSFVPETGTVDGLLGATTGGNTFTSTPTTEDFGADIDNCPKNMLELKKQTSIEAKMSGTFVTLSKDLAKTLIATADIDTVDETHIIPRQDILKTDFKDIWLVGDYSDENGEQNGGFCAIHLMNALSTGGFQIKTSDKAKGQFAYEFTGHYSMENQTKPPFEIFIKMGSAETP